MSNMKKTTVLIIGQGISGTWLAWWLEQSGISFHLLDHTVATAASPAAAGIINPVTGRRLVTTWMIDALMPFAKTAYQAMENFFEKTLIRETAVIDFFPSAQMRLAFEERYTADATYLFKESDENGFRDYFNYDLGCGGIGPCYLVDVMQMLQLCRKKWKEAGCLSERNVSLDEISVDENEIRVGDIHASKIIFCDGVGAAENPYFNLLPFAPNKGEALLLEIKGLPRENIYKKGMSLVPWQDDLFWIGSSYEWSFTDTLPTAAFRQRTEAVLREWLKIPFRVVNHLAAVRPATLERRPFVGFHPVHKNVGIFNGMGTKGCSLAPYFAHQLVEYIKGHAAIDPLADIKRFERILSRAQK